MACNTSGKSVTNTTFFQQAIGQCELVSWKRSFLVEDLDDFFVIEGP